MRRFQSGAFRPDYPLWRREPVASLGMNLWNFRRLTWRERRSVPYRGLEVLREAWRGLPRCRKEATRSLTSSRPGANLRQETTAERFDRTTFSYDLKLRLDPNLALHLANGEADRLVKALGWGAPIVYFSTNPTLNVTPSIVTGASEIERPLVATSK